MTWTEVIPNPAKKGNCNKFLEARPTTDSSGGVDFLQPEITSSEDDNLRWYVSSACPVGINSSPSNEP